MAHLRRISHLPGAILPRTAAADAYADTAGALPPRAPTRAPELTHTVCTGASPELVPKGFEVDVLDTEWAAAALEWMGQKDSLGQDFFLLGSHGPMRRWLALVYCARANREVEYLALTQDTTESDLKQRRELVPGGSAEYFDQGTLQAALHGRVLIVEGCAPLPLPPPP